jgi:hypothetical protein
VRYSHLFLKGKSPLSPFEKGGKRGKREDDVILSEQYLSTQEESLRVVY